MKRIWYLYALLLLSSCAVEPHDPEVNDFGGEIVAPTGDPVIVTQLLNPVQKAKGLTPTVDTLEVDSARWAGTQKKFEKGYYIIQYGKLKRKVFLVPGKSLFFKIDTQDSTNTVQYKGKMKKVARYLQDRQKAITSIRKEKISYFRLDEQPFLTKLDSSRKVLDSLFVQFVTNNPRFDEDFLKEQAIGNLYFSARIAYQYPRYAAYYNPSDSFSISENYKDNFKELDYNNSFALRNASYTRFLMTMIDEETNVEYEKNIEKYQNDDEAYFSLGFNISDSLITNNEVKQFVTYQLLNDIITYTAPDVAPDHLAYMEVNCTDSAYKAQLNSSLAEWAYLKPGNKAPGFSYPDINEQNVSLTDLKGKYVYVDVWATWCGPCKAEIPHLKKLEHKFREKNIAFVSISVDENVNAWRKMVKDKALKGIQLYTGGWQCDLSKEYKIQSIPRFLLIDPDGNIVSARAKRPSGGIEAELEVFLN